MIGRLALIGAALIVMGLLHFGSNATPTAVGGAVLLGAAGVIRAVQHQRGAPVRQVGRDRR